MNPEYSRRDFLKTTLVGSAAGLVGASWGCAAPVTTPSTNSVSSPAGASKPASKSRVSLTAGEDRADIAFKALKVFDKEIAAAIGDKRVILKPNNVMAETALACSDPQNLEGILEFLKSIGKLSNVIIAESGAGVPTLDGFAGLGYNPVAAKYKVKLVDLDTDEFEIVSCINQTDMRAHGCRVSRLLLDPNSFVISAAMTKTHDTVVATLSLKNIAMGAPLKINHGSDKRIVHGGGPWGINFNLANFASRLHPHLAVIDGYRGMEGNGPVHGTPVEHRLCIAAMDWLAADRVGLELMGIDPAQVGYLSYCAQMGLGEYQLNRIEVIGESVKDHVRKYRPADNLEQQLRWMTPPARQEG